MSLSDLSIKNPVFAVMLSAAMIVFNGPGARSVRRIELMLLREAVEWMSCMKDESEFTPRKEDFVQRTLSPFRRLARRFEVWIDYKLGINVYCLEGDEIVSGRGQRPEDRIKIQDVRAWQIHCEMCFDVVVNELNDGRVVNWFDKYNDLIGILHRVAADRKLPDVSA